MTDSVAVFVPGYRLTDSSTGEPIPGATIAFYDAGTNTPKTVYGDRNLLTALGTSVVTDSLGCPTSDGIAKTDVFVGTADYKVTISDASAVVIETKDNRPGAPVSASSADVAVTALFPVVTKSLDYAVLAADQNTTFAVNCSGGDVTLTLPSAVTVGAGWKIKVLHAGSANQALLAVASASGQLILEGSKSFGAAYALALNGEDLEVTSDGGNWRVSSHTTAFIKVAQGIIPITDRLATPPGSPVQGSLYLLTGIGGSWSGFAINDIVQYTGAAWVNFTPYTDCGWVAYIAATNLYYRFIDSAWVVETATSSVPGTVKVATQASQETATANDTAVTPGTQQFHPSAPKTWGMATVSAGVPTLAVSYNMTSITDTAQGKLGITIGTDFSSANHALIPGVDAGPSSNTRRVSLQTVAAGTATIVCTDSTDSPQDPLSWHWHDCGDQ